MTQEAFPAASDTGARMGEGEMPAALDTLNWNTVVWGGLWVLIYGAWSWLAILLGLTVLAFVAQLYVMRLGATDAAVIGLDLAYRATWYALLITFAYRANRTVWERERRRVARQSDQSVPRPAPLVATYVATQRKWFLLGLAFLAVSNVLSVLTIRTPVLRMTSAAGFAVTLMVILGLFVFERLRAGRPAPRS